MRINHLIWEHIFCDPEFGDLSMDIRDVRVNVFVRDRDVLAIMGIHNWDIKSLYDNIRDNFTHDEDEDGEENEPRNYQECRGIRVHVPREKTLVVEQIPTLRTSSALILVETWAEEFLTISIEMEKKIDGYKYPDTIKIFDSYTIDQYIIDQYVNNISKDALESIALYRIDLSRVNKKLLTTYNNDHRRSYGPQYYSEQFDRTNSAFRSIYCDISSFGLNAGLDGLKSISGYIEQLWKLLVDIFQIHHELILTLPKNYIRPKYSKIFFILQERIHLKARYTPI